MLAAGTPTIREASAVVKIRREVGSSPVLASKPVGLCAATQFNASLIRRAHPEPFLRQCGEVPDQFPLVPPDLLGEVEQSPRQTAGNAGCVHLRALLGIRVIGSKWNSGRAGRTPAPPSATVRLRHQPGSETMSGHSAETDSP